MWYAGVSAVARVEQINFELVRLGHRGVVTSILGPRLLQL